MGLLYSSDLCQEEARIAAREENMGSEDQALTTHTKKTRRDYHHSKGKMSHSRRDMSIVICYTCDEKVHKSKYFPNKGNSKKKRGNKRKHHAHAIEDDEPSTKRNKQVSDDSSVRIINP